MKHLYKAYNLYQTGGISCENICKDISKLVTSVSHDASNQWMVIVSIKKINEYDGDSLLPKITYRST